MEYELKDIITIGGISLTFFVGFAGLIIGVKNSKKTIFINSVTASRTKWIDTIRNSIAEFCGLTHHFSLTPLTDSEKTQVIEKIDRLRFLIKLQLNRNDEFDKKIIQKIDIIPDLTDSKKINELEKEINELIELTQDLLKLEWEGVKEETKKGNLTKKQKKVLLDKYLKINR